MIGEIGWRESRRNDKLAKIAADLPYHICTTILLLVSGILWGWIMVLAAEEIYRLMSLPVTL